MKTKFLSLIVMLLLAAPSVFAQSVSFSKQITVTAGPNTQNLFIGVNGDGAGPNLDNSVGLDTDGGLGAYQEAPAPPAPPAPFDFDCRIVTVPGRVTSIPNGLGGGVYKDYRAYFNSTQVDSFMVRIQGDYFDVNGATISWPAGLATNGTSWIIKPRSGSAFATTDMTTSTSVVVPAPSTGAPFDVIIIKTGAFVPAAVNFSAAPNPLAFGIVNTGNTTTQTLTITNTGTSTALNITAISTTFAGTDFSFVTTPTTPINLNAGQSTTIQVQFAPLAGGAQNASIQFTHNAAGSPTTINVTGTGNAQGGTLCFRSAGQNVGDALTGLRDTVQLSNYAGKALRALQFRIINGSNSRLNSVERGARVADPAKWIFQYEIGRGPVNPSTFAAIDTIRLVILGVSDSIDAGVGPHDLAYFTYSTTNTPLDTTTTMSLAEIVGSTSLGGNAQVTSCAGVQNIRITDLGIGQKGDSNADGFIDILDLLQVIDHILGRITLQGSAFTRSDVSPWPAGNGTLDATDVALLQQMILDGEFPDGTPLPFTGKGSSVTKSASRATLYLHVNDNAINARLDAPVSVKGVQMDVRGAAISAAPTSSNGTVLAGRSGRVLFYNVDGVQSGDLFTLPVNGMCNVDAANVIVADENNNAMDVNVVMVKQGATPAAFTLEQNYPNPFNPSTTISFSVPETMPVRVSVYNSLGNEVRSLFNGVAEAGTHNISWNGTDANGAAVTSGMYFYRMSADGFSAVRSMTLSK
ncbi:MAG TPA: choice-of-anchor D domain-containing protein [Bacteroidota bacterium]|nr:choice-of-anchor D domain-containing protein [Bacteroidota bacterium]